MLVLAMASCRYDLFRFIVRLLSWICIWFCVHMCICQIVNVTLCFGVFWLLLVRYLLNASLRLSFKKFLCFQLQLAKLRDRVGQTFKKKLYLSYTVQNMS